MDYDQTIDYLFSAAPMFQRIGSAAYKEGMENSFLIDERLGKPHRRYATIHIAGTNGKGSVSHLLASVLQEAGYKTGLYTSPHLTDFRERIRVGGQMIDKQFIIDFIAEHKLFFESIAPSFFELTTGMAFKYFAEQQVDVAVIEVGLGGRLDCTNVISPIVSVITNISLDHTNLLGSTLRAIAGEKAGIIKADVPVVIGEATDEVRCVFEKARGNGQMIFAEDEHPIESERILPDGCWQLETKKYGSLVDPLGGYAQVKNAATTLCVIDLINNATRSGSSPEPRQLHIPDMAVVKGFRRVTENTALAGRWQRVGHKPEIVLDTGHNVGGMCYNIRQMKAETVGNLHIVYGMVGDKDIEAVLEMMPREATYYFTQASIPRALPCAILAEKAEKFGLQGAVFLSVAEAVSAAIRAARPDDFIFIGGSTFVVADAINFADFNKKDGC